MSCCAKISTCLPEAHVARHARNFSSETFETFLLIPDDTIMLCPSHPINFHPKKWDELHRCKLFVTRSTLSALDSVRPQHRLKAQYRPTWCVYGSLMALLAILALYVYLFVFFFSSFWSTISSLFLFMTCPILTHFGRHIVINLTIKATDKSHRALASWPQETTFRNLE